MKKRTIVLAAVVCSTACVRPAPRAAPAPVPAATVAVAPDTDFKVVLQSPPATSTDNKSAKPSNTSRLSTTDVNRRAVEMFGDPTATTAVPDSAAPEAPSWDIDVHSYESTDRVEHYVDLFTGPAKERIEARLTKGTRYEPMIRAKLREGGIPEDMYYLALIESGFDPNAYSRAAAVGMWQFMTSTARDVGLRVDWWVDERRDPIKSTGAAVRFIKGLRDQFGSLYLAAAAYNGGPGRIARGLERYADDFEGTTGDDLFFALAEKDYLRNETRDYVPQLIAAALIGKEPDKYGMKIVPETPFAYDSLCVGPATPLAAVAHAAGVPVSAVRDLNPYILRGITPPKDSFFVRIPTGTADSAQVHFADLPKSERVGLHAVVSKKGQNFASIAKSEGISSRQLALYNPSVHLLKSGNLAAGQTVTVPTEAVVDAAAPVPDPAIERYSSPSSSTTVHVVRSGESLSTIAKKYHTTTAALMRSNGMKRDLIFPGQSLIVRGGSAKAPASSKAKSSSKVSSTSKTKSSSSKKTASTKSKVSATKSKATTAKSSKKPSTTKAKTATSKKKSGA